MTTHFFGDTAVLTGRSLRHITRSLDTIITTTVMPIAFLLLFVFVFGGALGVQTGSIEYVDFITPGVLIMTIGSGIAYAAVRLSMDLQKGIIGRFRTMPVAPSLAPCTAPPVATSSSAMPPAAWST